MLSRETVDNLLHATRELLRQSGLEIDTLQLHINLPQEAIKKLDPVLTKNMHANDIEIYSVYRNNEVLELTTTPPLPIDYDPLINLD